MHKPTSPFTREQLLPKEETLEIDERKRRLVYWHPKRNLFSRKKSVSHARCRFCTDKQWTPYID